MSGSRMTVTEKTYLKDRACELFNPIIERLEDRLIPVKAKIKAKVAKTMGLAQARKEMDKVIERLHELNEAHIEMTGDYYTPIDRLTTSRQYQSYQSNDSPFTREVEAQLNATKEAVSCVAVRAQLQSVKDEVMLAGFAEDVQGLFKAEIPKMLLSFNGDDSQA